MHSSKITKAHIPDVDNPNSLQPPAWNGGRTAPSTSAAPARHDSNGEGTTMSAHEPKTARGHRQSDARHDSFATTDNRNLPGAFRVQPTGQHGPSSTMDDDMDGSDICSYRGDGSTTMVTAAEVVPSEEEMARLEAELNERVRLEMDARLQQRLRQRQAVAEAVRAGGDDEGAGGLFRKRSPKFKVRTLLCAVLPIVAVIAAVVLLASPDEQAPAASSSPVGESTAAPTIHDVRIDKPTQAPTIVTTDQFKFLVDAVGDGVVVPLISDPRTLK
jgi:hypothetical protein